MKSTSADAVRKTEEIYSFLWNETGEKGRFPGCHYEKMQEAIPEAIVAGNLGLEAGCGTGLDTAAMAKANPLTEIISFDISDSVYAAARLAGGLKNARILKASSLDLPFRDNSFDFCYSFGVIHHTPNPARCFREIRRVLKDGKKIFLYLYEDHAGNIWKRYPLKLVSLTRRVSTKLDKRLLYILATIASPIVFLVFSVPAIVLRKFARTEKIAAEIPFNFARNPFSLAGDLYDRFGAPIEFRFSERELNDLLGKAGFCDIKFTRLKARAGIVVWAKK